MDKPTVGTMYRSIADILLDFKAPINPDLVSSKPSFSRGQKSGNISYIAWYNLVDELERIAPGWEFTLRTQFLPDRCVIEGRLTIKAQEGEFTREATGVEMLDSNGYGDPVYSAEASALRRAMAKFGYALDLWRKDSKALQSSYKQPVKTTADLEHKTVTQPRQSLQRGGPPQRAVSQKQIGLLYAVAKNESGLADEDVKHIIKQYGYESTKEIKQSDFDPILTQIKTAARFVTIQQRKDLVSWWQAERVSDDVAKKGLEAIGYKGTAQILRSEINAVKSAILQEAGKLVESR